MRKGILIYGLLFILFGLYGFASILYKATFIKDLSEASNVSIINLLIYTGQLFVGYNLIKRKGWARVASIVILILGLVFVIFGMFSLPIKGGALPIVGFVGFCLLFISVFGFGIYYLSKQDTKEIFNTKQ